jgi:hypothetical protein
MEWGKTTASSVHRKFQTPEFRVCPETESQALDLLRETGNERASTPKK